jgi:hypothetical protein
MDIHMWSVLMLFLIPVGGGIPAGVLLAGRQGIAWPVTAALYFVSDVILALVFEPVLLVLAAVGRRLPIVARLGAAMGHAMEQMAARHIGGGPFALILVAFGIDPMTGRAAALASGHGFIGGWAIAIAGDMLYYSVIAITTAQLGAYVHDPNTVMLIVLAAMILVPMVVRRVRGAAPHS